MSNAETVPAWKRALAHKLAEKKASEDSNPKEATKGSGLFGGGGSSSKLLSSFEELKTKVADLTEEEFDRLKVSGQPFKSVYEIRAALPSIREQIVLDLKKKQTDDRPNTMETPVDLSTWTQRSGVNLTVYRAENTDPYRRVVMKQGFPAKEKLGDIGEKWQELLRAPKSFLEGHVRANWSWVQSATTDPTCAGYASSRPWVYVMNLGEWNVLTPPSDGEVAQELPIIWYQGDSLEGMTRFAWDARKVTDEVDLPFDITMAEVTAVINTRSGTRTDMTAGLWATVTEGNVLAKFP